MGAGEGDPDRVLRTGSPGDGVTLPAAASPVPAAADGAHPYAWKMIVLVYRNIDATYIDQSGVTQHAVHAMSDRDYNYVMYMLSRLADTIATWSAGDAIMNVTVVTVDEPMRSLNADGSANEYQARKEIDRYNPGGVYDCISIVYSLDDIWVSGVASVGLSGTANGAGFSRIHVPINYIDWGSTYPEEIFIHEWLHNVEGYYRGLGYNAPNLHDAEAYGYQPDPNAGGSWHEWYEDYMQNKVWDGSQYIGVPLAAWQSHVPTGPVDYPAPGLAALNAPADASSNISNSPVIGWSVVPGASWYALQVSTDPAFGVNLIDRWIGASTYQAVDLAGGTHYYYRARAMNAAGAGAWSPAWSFTTQAGPPVSGSALRVDGVNDHVRVLRQIADDFTLEAWIKTNSSLSGYAAWDGRGVIYADVPGPGDDFGTAVLNGKFAFFTGNPDVTVQSAAPVDTGAWVHVAAVRVRQTGTLRVYVNGVESGTLTGASTAALNTPVYIDIGGNLVDDRCFDGLIDEVRIWNVARTGAQIAANMNQRLVGTEPGLLGYWRFDDAAGETARDTSPSGNDGSVRYGPVWIPSTAPLVDRPGDFDGDGDADLADFSHLQGCFNGPNRAYAVSGCKDADFDGDTDVDLTDFMVFQGCFNGPNRTPACE
jgi:hypothetical protein